MTPHDLIAAFETLADAPDGVKRLRELVLHLAVRGKLVPQDPTEGRGDELLLRLVSERARFTREFALRRIAIDLPVGKELPHEIPSSWAWCRLSVVAYPQAGCAFSSTHFNQQGHGLPLIRIRDVLRGRSDTYYAGEYRHEFLVGDGDHLVGMDGNFNIGRWTGGVALLNQRVCRLRWYSSNAVPDFVVAALQHRLDDLHGVKAYTTVQHLSGKQIEQALIPLPPLAEQHRIVARVDELMGLLDRFEAARNARDATRTAARDAALAALRDADDAQAVQAAWARIADQMDDLFTHPNDVAPLRQTILQLAVRGRLVPQDPTDEPARILLQRIAAEKARLVKEGKIRKVEPLPPIRADEVPFAVPDGWEWTRLGALGLTQTGATPPKLEGTPDEARVPFVRPNDIGSGRVDTERESVPRRAAESTGRLVSGRAVFMVCIGSVGNVGYCDVEATFNQQINALEVLEADFRFVAVGLEAPFFKRSAMARASATTLAILNKGKWERLLVPLPPLAEQHRIVARVDELMALCDALESKLSAAADTRGRFAAAAVHHLDA